MYLYYLQNSLPLESREKELARLKGELRSLSEAAPRCSLANPFSHSFSSVTLETCDRYEIYTAEPISEALQVQLFTNTAKPESPESLWRQEKDLKALRHLFRVVSGLESPMFGEKAIQGQVKQAYSEASAQKDPKKLAKELHLNFQNALRVGKRVRRETQLDFGAMSHVRVAWEIMEQELGKEALQDLSICLIGATRLSEEFIELFCRRGIHKFFLGNRDYERALHISQIYGGKAFGLKHTAEVLQECQVLISATRAPHYIVRREHILGIRQPLYAFDFAVPRDIDPQLGTSIKLWNIEDLEQRISINKEKRRSKSVQAEQIIAEELERCYELSSA